MGLIRVTVRILQQIMEIADHEDSRSTEERIGMNGPGDLPHHGIT